MTSTDEGNWVSLKDASTRAGVSISWLRKQYRSNGLPTRETLGPRGMQKSVPLDEVLRRAAVFSPPPGDPRPVKVSQPAAGATAPAPGSTSELTAALFDRLFDAQARAARAEAESAYLLLKLDDAYAEIEQLRRQQG